MQVGSYPKKFWFLAVLGLAALALGLATLFTSLTEEPIDISATVPLPVGSSEFATAAEAVTRSSRQPITTPIQVFSDGNAFLDDLLAEIERAQGSVTLTNYIFREGRMSNATFDALAERARAGVEVRVLLDWKGSTKAPDARIEALQAAGGKVAVFRPLSLRYVTRLYRRTHMRAIVIDGRVGYTGGMAFDDGWLGDGVGPEQWRDLMFKYDGPMARATQDQFNALWRQTSGEILAGSRFYPTLGTDSVGGAGSVHTLTLRAAADTVSGPAAETLAVPGEPTTSSVPADGSWFVDLFHNPMPDLSTDLEDLLWLSITGASRSISIATPYMALDAQVREAIIAAARRGVRVEVVMPGPYTDAKLIQAATRAYYDELLEAGVRIFEYQPGRFHEKTLTVDGRWSVIGSANMDNRSANLNIENVFAIEDPALARALEEELAFSKGRAREVTLQSFRPNPLETLYFHAARIFAKQY